MKNEMIEWIVFKAHTQYGLFDWYSANRIYLSKCETFLV